MDAPSKSTYESKLNGASSIFLMLLGFQLNQKYYRERKKKRRKQ
jgi:hypothetical protein